MTGYTVHTGSTEKFCRGWDEIFAEQKTVKKPAKKITAAKAGKKTAKTKQAAKKKKS